MSLLEGLEMHNLRIELHQPITIIGAYGMKKTGHILLMHVDDKTAFVAEIQGITNLRKDS